MSYKHSDSNELIRRFERMLHNKEQVSFPEESFGNVIEFYTEKGKFKEALKACNLALSQYPFSSDFKFNKAQILLYTGNYEEALFIIDSLENFQPFDLELNLLKSNLLCSLGKYDEAVEALHSLQNYYREGQDEIFFNLGVVYKYWGKAEVAVEYFKKAILENIEHEAATFELTYTLENQKKLGEAVSFYEKIIDDDPYNYLAWFYLGEIYERLGQAENALQAFEYATLIKDDFADAYFGMGTSYMNLHHYIEARQVFEKVLALEEEADADVFCHLAATYEKNKEYAQAIMYYQKAIAIDNRWDEAWFGIGSCFYAQEKWLEAIQNFKKASQLNPDNPEYFLCLADAEQDFGSWVSADENYQIAANLDPFRAKIWLNWSYLYYQQNDYSRAIEIIEQGLEDNPENSEMLYRHIAYLMTQGQFKEAFRYLELALSLYYEEHSFLYDFFEDLEIQKALFKVIQQYKEM
ncbi:MAG: tetratricopeptide repeat protein [Thermonemataceae bacterium]|nr:tetratricopeptide repeat protein [Thermonemataceae bacterium]